jgi:hypothetical protein
MNRPSFVEHPAMRLLLAAALGVGLVVGTLAAVDSPDVRMVEPARVTLGNAKIPLGKALEELTKQTNIRVEDNRGDVDPDLDLRFDRTPFWEALDTIAAQAKAGVQINPRSGTIALVKRPPDALPVQVSHSGPFRVAVKKTTASLDFDSGQNVYTTYLEVAWEPGLQPLYLETKPRDLAIKGADGKVLPIEDEGSSMAGVTGLISMTLDVGLPPISRTARTLGAMEGKLSVLAPSRMITFTSPNTLDRIEKGLQDGVAETMKEDGVVCKVSKVVLTRDRWTVQVTLEYPRGAMKLESYQSWTANNEMVLENKDKVRLKPTGYLIDASSARRAVINYHFTDQDKMLRGRAANWRVVYRTPASVVEMPFAFKFKDVPLP